MESLRTDEDATLSEERMAVMIEEKTPLEPGEVKTELSELIRSLNRKLDELVLVNSRLLESANSSKQREPEAEETETSGFSQNITPQDSFTEPALEYRISSILDFLRRWYAFEDCGVFLINRNNTGLEKLISSTEPWEGRCLGGFEDEVKARWEKGDFTPAISQKRRTVLPADKGGSWLVIPFWIPEDKEGLWVAHFRDTSFPEKSISSELSFWVEMISFCIENSNPKKAASFSPQQSKTHHIEAEKLRTTAEISRAAVHEMNNHLQVILGRTQLLRINEKKHQKTSPNIGVLETIEENTNRVCSTLKDFSDHLRRQFTRTTEKGEVNIRRLLEGNFEFLKYILKEQKIEWELRLDDEIPLVYGNPGEIELAFLSLFLGLRDELFCGGIICLQVSAVKDSLCLNIGCVPKKTPGGKLPRWDELNINRRLEIASRILERQQGQFKLEKFGEDEISLSLVFPIAPQENGMGELSQTEIAIPESCLQAEDSQENLDDSVPYNS